MVVVDAVVVVVMVIVVVVVVIMVVVVVMVEWVLYLIVSTVLKNDIYIKDIPGA